MALEKFSRNCYFKLILNPFVVQSKVLHLHLEKSIFNFETIFQRIKFNYYITFLQIFKTSNASNTPVQLYRANYIINSIFLSLNCNIYLRLYLIDETLSSRVTRDSRTMELSRVSPPRPRTARGTGVSSGDRVFSLLAGRTGRRQGNRNRAPDSVPLYDRTHLRAYCITSTWAVWLPLSPCSNRLEDFCSLTGHHYGSSTAVIAV